MGSPMVFTGSQIDGFRLRVVASAMSLYLKTGMKVNRAYTPTNMTAVVSEYTGKTYARSRTGLEEAYADLLTIINAGH